MDSELFCGICGVSHAPDVRCMMQSRVEDSHAKLAITAKNLANIVRCRFNLDLSDPDYMGLLYVAARVEQLGQAVEHYRSQMRLMLTANEKYRIELGRRGRVEEKKAAAIEYVRRLFLDLKDSGWESNAFWRNVFSEFDALVESEKESAA